MSAGCSFRAAPVLGGQHSNEEAPRQRAPIVSLSHGCGLRPQTRTSFHHQPEAQHPKSSVIHKSAGRLPHLWVKSGFPCKPHVS